MKQTLRSTATLLTDLPSCVPEDRDAFDANDLGQDKVIGPRALI